MKLLVFGGTGQVGHALRALAGPELAIDAPARALADLNRPQYCAALIAATSRR